VFLSLQMPNREYSSRIGNGLTNYVLNGVRRALAPSLFHFTRSPTGCPFSTRSGLRTDVEVGPARGIQPLKSTEDKHAYMIMMANMYTCIYAFELKRTKEKTTTMARGALVGCSSHGRASRGPGAVHGAGSRCCRGVLRQDLATEESARPWSSP
jgi:hypothetical protein